MVLAGFDSLDSVEVIITIEDEFAVEIEDKSATEFRTVNDVVDYIARTPFAM